MHQVLLPVTGKVCKSSAQKSDACTSCRHLFIKCLYLIKASCTDAEVSSGSFWFAGRMASARVKHQKLHPRNYRLITAYLLLRMDLDKIMHARWDFDASSARTRRVSALDKHQNWSAGVLFCQNSQAQSKYAVVNLIHTRRKQFFFVFYYVINKTF